jgi:hypothetical protein
VLCRRIHAFHFSQVLMPPKRVAANTQEEVTQLYNSVSRKRPSGMNMTALQAVPVNSAPHNNWIVGDAVYVYSAAKSIWVSGTIVDSRKPHREGAQPKKTVHNDRPVVIVRVDDSQRPQVSGSRAIAATLSEQIRVPVVASAPTS